MASRAQFAVLRVACATWVTQAKTANGARWVGTVPKRDATRDAMDPTCFDRQTPNVLTATPPLLLARSLIA